MQKILVIFIGSFFQITLMVAVAVARRGAIWWKRRIPFGATNKSVVRRVITPGRRRKLRNCCAWSGLGMDLCHRGGTDWFIQRIGHMLSISRALLNTGQMIFGIIVIGCIGLLSDLVV